MREDNAAGGGVGKANFQGGREHFIARELYATKTNMNQKTENAAELRACEGSPGRGGDSLSPQSAGDKLSLPRKHFLAF
jgi:hypothetical protein